MSDLFELHNHLGCQEPSKGSLSREESLLRGGVLPREESAKSIVHRRVLALWFPDWPAVSALLESRLPLNQPMAVMSANRVFACTATARSLGVKRGLRRRDVQRRCSELVLVDRDDERDARRFEAVLAGFDDVCPGVEVLRPGLVIISARGITRYHGSEEAAAEVLLTAAAHAGVDCQVGAADSLSTAVLAARYSTFVPPHGGREFLASLPIEVLSVEQALGGGSKRDKLVDLLRRLGIYRVGDFAALPQKYVATRFSADALTVHRLASAEKERVISPRIPPPSLGVEEECHPPLARVDEAAFLARRLAVSLHERVAAVGMACTRLGIKAVISGTEFTRVWRCVTPLTSQDTADRVRWQLDGWLTTRASRGAGLNDRAGLSRGASLSDRRGAYAQRRAIDGNGRQDVQGVVDGHALGEGSEDIVDPDSAGLTYLALEPLEVVNAGTVQSGLWGEEGEAQDRRRRVLTRLQGILGVDEVQVGVASGGRGPVDRVSWSTFGEAQEPVFSVDAVWSGQLLSPSPTVIFSPKRSAGFRMPEGKDVHDWNVLEKDMFDDDVKNGIDMCDDTGAHIYVTGRGLLSGVPAWFVDGRSKQRIVGWSPPWLIDEWWWSGDRAQRLARMQIVTDELGAFLLACRRGIWEIEGEYA